ncbi:unnamed protein product [Strongylus vulgaris]|uniref:Uncharacterized protein n=1 Tax=Strongylus vulgaris TaxID=40348 RepID=A0A3P7JB29_STRVU|nr:unnamed protein product [Strongylus vulgaris]
MRTSYWLPRNARMKDMSASEMFWKQLREHIENYGATMVAGLLIGYFLHYIMNVRPLKQRIHVDKLEQSEDDEEMKADNTESLKPEEKEEKQVGVVKGMINTEVLESLRRRPPPERPRSALPEFKTIPENKPLFEDRMQDSTSSDVEDNDDLNGSLSDRDLLHTLGTLHGKLATAQLRARTRKMQADMTAEERDDVSLCLAHNFVFGFL